MRARLLILSALCSMFVAQVASAAYNTGTIAGGYSITKVCHSADCTTPTPGVLNFLPTGSTPVYITDSGITGMAWGDELGWVNLDPTGDEGLKIDPMTGVITGKAWSQVAGWVNFSPTGQAVSIDRNGAFTGWAWAGGPYGGWIKFDCTDAGACIKTDWRPIPARPVNGPIAFSTASSSPADTCWNIEGIQFTVPDGLVRDGNSCVSPDVCPNVPGVQFAVPPGYTRDEGGVCSLVVDYCPNLPDIQYAVPGGYVVTDAGDCVLAASHRRTSYVSFVESDTQVAAVGHVAAKRPHTGVEDVRNDTVAMPSDSMAEVATDVCLNIPGDQSTEPDGYTRNSFGECVPEVTDYCPNIDGNQANIPDGYVVDDVGNCILGVATPMANGMPTQEINGNGGGDTIGAGAGGVAFSFVPSFLQARVTSPKLASVMRWFSGGSEQSMLVRDTDPGNPSPRVDLTGIILMVLAGGAFVGALGYGIARALAHLFIKKFPWGVVFDVESGLPIAGARLLLYNAAGQQVAESVAAADGSYTFGVPSGEYSVRAVVPQYQQQLQSGDPTTYSGGSITVTSGVRFTQNIALKKMAATAVTPPVPTAAPVPAPAAVVPTEIARVAVQTEPVQTTHDVPVLEEKPVATPVPQSVPVPEVVPEVSVSPEPDTPAPEPVVQAVTPTPAPERVVAAEAIPTVQPERIPVPEVLTTSAPVQPAPVVTTPDPVAETAPAPAPVSEAVVEAKASLESLLVNREALVPPELPKARLTIPTAAMTITPGSGSPRV